MSSHSFLVESGHWILQGSWLERNQKLIPVNGSVKIRWNERNWFTMETRLVFPNESREEISFQYRGHFYGEKAQYTYLMKQSLLGRVEGEGWIAPESIVQRYWVLGDHQKRNGFESFYRVNQTTYRLSSGIFTGHYITSTMEATLERQI